jgi:hypothetical protein
MLDLDHFYQRKKYEFALNPREVRASLQTQYSKSSFYG